MTGLRVGASPGRGRGVFAVSGFERGDVVEEAPVISFPCDTWWAHDGNAVLRRYSFSWGDWDEAVPPESALVLGYGSLYNHSYCPNANYLQDPERSIMRFVAVSRIEPGAEIFINYRGMGRTDPIRDFGMI